MSAKEFVNAMRDKKELIMGIGHRVKSLANPDMRVELLKKFVKENFKEVCQTSRWSPSQCNGPSRPMVLRAAYHGQRNI
jgi:citrate synthase